METVNSPRHGEPVDRTDVNKCVPPMLALARAEMSRGNNRAACGYLRRAVALHGENRPLLFEIATLLRAPATHARIVGIAKQGC